MFITHDCVLMNVAYNNFGDLDSNKPLTERIKHGIFALVRKEIILLCRFDIPYFTESSIFIPEYTKCKLTAQLHILSLQLFDERKSVPQNL